MADIEEIQAKLQQLKSEIDSAETDFGTKLNKYIEYLDQEKKLANENFKNQNESQQRLLESDQGKRENDYKDLKAKFTQHSENINKELAKVLTSLTTDQASNLRQTKLKELVQGRLQREQIATLKKILTTPYFVDVKDYENISADEYQDFVRAIFQPYISHEFSTEEGCGRKSVLISPNQYQKFVKYWFNVYQPFLGLLLWHNVGAGKTCAAVSAAVQSFLKEGWKFIWVTSRFNMEAPYLSLKEGCHEILFKKFLSKAMIEAETFDTPEDEIKERAKIYGIKNIDQMIEKRKLRNGDPKTEMTNLLGEIIAQHNLEEEYPDYRSFLWNGPFNENPYINIVSYSDFMKAIKDLDNEKWFEKKIIVIDEVQKIMPFNWDDEDSLRNTPNEFSYMDYYTTFKDKLYNAWMDGDKIKQNGPKILLLTATPMNQEGWELLEILSLIKPFHKDPFFSYTVTTSRQGKPSRYPEKANIDGFPTFGIKEIGEQWEIDGHIPEQLKEMIVKIINGCVSYVYVSQNPSVFPQPILKKHFYIEYDGPTTYRMEQVDDEAAKSLEAYKRENNLPIESNLLVTDQEIDKYNVLYDKMNKTSNPKVFEQLANNRTLILGKKLIKCINQIKEIDNRDSNQANILFKHVIFYDNGSADKNDWEEIERQLKNNLPPTYKYFIFEKPDPEIQRQILGGTEATGEQTIFNDIVTNTIQNELGSYVLELSSYMGKNYDLKTLAQQDGMENYFNSVQGNISDQIAYENKIETIILPSIKESIDSMDFVQYLSSLGVIAGGKITGKTEAGKYTMKPNFVDKTGNFEKALVIFYEDPNVLLTEMTNTQFVDQDGVTTSISCDMKKVDNIDTSGKITYSQSEQIGIKEGQKFAILNANLEAKTRYLYFNRIRVLKNNILPDYRTNFYKFLKQWIEMKHKFIINNFENIDYDQNYRKTLVEQFQTDDNLRVFKSKENITNLLDKLKNVYWLSWPGYQIMVVLQYIQNKLERTGEYAGKTQNLNDDQYRSKVNEWAQNWNLNTKVTEIITNNGEISQEFKIDAETITLTLQGFDNFRDIPDIFDLDYQMVKLDYRIRRGLAVPERQAIDRYEPTNPKARIEQIFGEWKKAYDNIEQRKDFKLPPNWQERGVEWGPKNREAKWDRKRNFDEIQTKMADFAKFVLQAQLLYTDRDTFDQMIVKTIKPIHDQSLARLITQEINSNVLRIINQKTARDLENKLNILVLGPKQREGISLKGDVRYFHILKPFSTITDQEQGLGRVLRYCGVDEQYKGWQQVKQNEGAYNIHVNQYEMALSIHAVAVASKAIPGMTEQEQMKRFDPYQLTFRQFNKSMRQIVDKKGLDMEFINRQNMVEMETLAIKNAIDYKLHVIHNERRIPELGKRFGYKGKEFEETWYVDKEGEHLAENYYKKKLERLYAEKPDHWKWMLYMFEEMRNDPALQTELKNPGTTEESKRTKMQKWLTKKFQNIYNYSLLIFGPEDALVKKSKEAMLIHNILVKEGVKYPSVLEKLENDFSKVDQGDQAADRRFLLQMTDLLRFLLNEDPSKSTELKQANVDQYNEEWETVQKNVDFYPRLFLTGKQINDKIIENPIKSRTLQRFGYWQYFETADILFGRSGYLGKIQNMNVESQTEWRKLYNDFLQELGKLESLKENIEVTPVSHKNVTGFWTYLARFSDIKDDEELNRSKKALCDEIPEQNQPEWCKAQAQGQEQEE